MPDERWSPGVDMLNYMQDARRVRIIRGLVSLRASTESPCSPPLRKMENDGARYILNWQRRLTTTSAGSYAGRLRKSAT